ncbi:MAG: CBS domain-containing protein [Nitrososphaerota archaeon]|nr:CBS domain-containing protein [Nitrososphaerota archaeon]MDG6940359.1 CBS domain-containing protein [Nitrososphaerota archaeon]
MPRRTADLWWLFSRQTVSVTEEESIIGAAMLMKKRNFRHLPVLDNGKVIGMLSAQDVIDSLNLAFLSSVSPSELLYALEIPIQRVMSFPVVAVERGDGLADVVKKFIHHNLGALVVVNEVGDVEGIVTLRDLIGLIGTSSEPIGVEVSELMNRKIMTITPEHKVSQAVQLMSRLRVRRLPTVGADGRVLGVLSSKDILRYIARLAGGESRLEFDGNVSQLMTSSPTTVGSKDDVREAATRMMIFGVGGLLIDDLPGTSLITERDVVRGLATKSLELAVKSMQFELETATRVM